MMADGLAIKSERKDSPFLPAENPQKNWLETVPQHTAETILIVPYIKFKKLHTLIYKKMCA